MDPALPEQHHQQDERSVGSTAPDDAIQLPARSSERKRRHSTEDVFNVSSSSSQLESDLDTGCDTTPGPFASDFDFGIKERKKFVRRKWSDEEQAAVYKHLGHFINAKNLHGRSAIDACKRAELVLENRTWRNIKDSCRNSMITKH